MRQAASWACLVALLVVSGLRNVTNPMVALALLVPQALFLIPPAGLLLVCRRDRRARRLNYLSLLLVMAIFCKPSLHLPGRAGPDDIKVLTYNLDGGAESAGRLPREIAESGADLIFLQETEPNHQDPMPAIRRALRGSWHELRSKVRPELLILSRLRLSRGAEVALLPGVDHVVLMARADWGGRSVLLINVHLNPNRPGEVNLGARSWADFPEYVRRTARSRQAQLVALERLVARESGPIVVAGDFNTPASWPSPLAARLGDCFTEAGWGWGLTYSERLPLWRIDHIWKSSDLATVRASAISSGASDHRACRAVLRAR